MRATSRFNTNTLVILLLAAGMAGGCASTRRDGVAVGSGGAAAGGTPTSGDGGAVTLRQGTPLVIGLPADPTAGYGWVLTLPGTPQLAPIGGPDWTPTPLPDGALAVAGTTTYRFRALDPGTSAIEFTWRAPPGQPAGAARVVRYDVTVTPGGWWRGLF